MPLAHFDSKNGLGQERIQIYRERRRQARVSFDLALVITAASTLSSFK